MYFLLDIFEKSNIISLVGQTLGNSVTVARQTLTLFVGVRIPIPQPINNNSSFRVGCYFFVYKGFEPGRSEVRAEENSPVDCFRCRGQRAQRGDRREAPEKSLSLSQKESINPCGWCFSFFVMIYRDSNKEGARKKATSQSGCFLLIFNCCLPFYHGGAFR